MIAVTGGMSVDPDDVTPAGIRASGGRIVTYGAPVLPGAMFMLAYIGKIPVMGLPGCVMYHDISIFDLILPRILAGEEITRADIVKLAHGGLCSHCGECRYPNCGFWKERLEQDEFQQGGTKCFYPNLISMSRQPWPKPVR